MLARWSSLCDSLLCCKSYVPFLFRCFPPRVSLRVFSLSQFPILRCPESWPKQAFDLFGHLSCFDRFSWCKSLGQLCESYWCLVWSSVGLHLSSSSTLYSYQGEPVDGCASHGHWGRADSLGDCSEYCGISLTDVSPCVSPMLLSRLLGHLRLGIM